MRIIDKLQRIKTFTNDGVLSVPDESVEDACEDIVNYAILAKAMLLESRESLRKQRIKREVEEIVKKG